MRDLSQPPKAPSLHRVERCWLLFLIILVIVGPGLAAVGLGGTLLGLIAFLVVFGVAATLLISRELRPGVSLVSSADHRHLRRA